jgi:hypothetical protein
MELKGKSMSELIAMYNELASAHGKPAVTEFKNLAAARSAIQHLETPTMDTEATPSTGTEGDKAKYNSTGKRGPNQGIGLFAKELITAGQANKEVLEAVLAKFPEAKTTMGCIAYYRTALKGGGTGRKGPNPEALEAKAQELLAKAAAAREAQAAAEAAKAEAPAA